MTRRAGALVVLALCGVSTPAAGEVRIAVLGLFHSSELIARSADGRGLSLRMDGDGCALRDAENAHVSERGGGSMRIVCAGRTFRARTLRITSPAGGVAAIELGIPQRISRTFRGSLAVTSAGGALIPVVSMDLETAVASIVAAEEVEGAPIEALKAQAVAARSYLVAARGRHRGSDFCDTTHCQFLREAPAPGHPATRAANETADLVLAFRGTPIAALYSASCGGRTRSLADTGLDAADGYPYYSVDCPYCVLRAKQWERRLQLDESSRQLDASRSERARLQVGRRFGWASVPGNNFDADREPDALVLHGRGAGHGVGLCQLGAAAFAAERSATFAEILDHYYPGTTLAGRYTRDR